MKKIIAGVLALSFLTAPTTSFAKGLNISDSQEVVLIVELEGDSVLATDVRKQIGAYSFYDTKQASKTQDDIISVQKMVVDEIDEKVDEDIEMLYTYTYLFNGFAIETDRKYIDEIKKLDNVKNVYESVSWELELPEETVEINSLEDYVDQSYECCDMIGVDYAHLKGFRGEGQVMAIIDTEFDVAHEFFSKEVVNPTYTKNSMQQTLENLAQNGGLNVDVSINQVYRNSKIPFAYNYGIKSSDTYSNNSKIIHGTHVLGIAAGKDVNLPVQSNFSGVAPEAQVIAMSVTNANGQMSDATITAAIDDAAKFGVTAINLSLGIKYSMFSTPLEKAVNTATKAGIFVSASSGNDGIGRNKTEVICEDIDYSTSGVPANIESASSVASVDVMNSGETVILSDMGEEITSLNSDLDMSWFSSWGTRANLELKPEITAPGGGIISSYPDNRYAIMSGTSMAAPHITGAATLINQYIDAELSNLSIENKKNFIENLMMSTADIIYQDDGIINSPRHQGAGLLDIEGAITTPVILYNDQGKTSVSLKDIENEFSVGFISENFSDNDVVYDNIEVKLATQGSYLGEDGKNYVGDMIPLDFKLTAPQNVLVDANSDAYISVGVSVDKEVLDENLKVYKNGFYIDGYVILSNSDDEVPQLNIPFMGFYGDWCSAPIVKEENVKIYYKDLDVFAGENHIAKRSLGDNYNPSEYEGEEYQFIAADKEFLVYFSNERATVNQKIEIINSQNDVVRTCNLGTVKKFVDNLSAVVSPLKTVGEYTLKMSGKLAYENAQITSVYKNFKTDNQKPQITTLNVYDEGGNTYLDIEIEDDNYLMGAVVTGKTKQGQDMIGYMPITPQKTVKRTLNITQLAPESLTVQVFDYANNQVLRSIMDVDILFVGEPIISTNDMVFVTEINNHTSGQKTVDLFIASYTDNGRLLCVDKVEDAILNKGINTKTFQLKKVDQTHMVKVFAFEGDNTLTPVSNSKEIFVSY